MDSYLRCICDSRHLTRPWNDRACLLPAAQQKVHFKEIKAGRYSGITAAFLLRQLGESLEASLGGHQASNGLEMALQLSVKSRQLSLLG